jgi:hypothetical protein
MTIVSPPRRRSPPTRGPRREVFEVRPFDKGHTELAPGMKGKITDFLQMKPSGYDDTLNHLIQTGRAKVYLIGHASDTGTRDLNVSIAAGRIKSMDTFLRTEAHIAPTAIGNSENAVQLRLRSILKISRTASFRNGGKSKSSLNCPNPSRHRGRNPRLDYDPLVLWRGHPLELQLVAPGFHFLPSTP